MSTLLEFPDAARARLACPACGVIPPFVETKGKFQSAEKVPAKFFFCGVCGHLFVRNDGEPGRNMNAAEKEWLRSHPERDNVIALQERIVKRYVG